MKKIESLTKIGDFKGAEALIRERLALRIATGDRRTLADAAMRSHQFELAIKILHPRVFPENSRGPGGSEEERVIYVLALQGLGSTRAAHCLLDTISVVTAPITLRIRGTLYRKTWAFERALPWLEHAEARSAPGTIEWLVCRKERLLALLLTEGQGPRWFQLYNEIPDTYSHPEPLLLECHFIRALGAFDAGQEGPSKRDLLGLRDSLRGGAFGSILTLVESLLEALNERATSQPSAPRAPLATDLTHPDYFRIVEYLLAKRARDQSRLLRLYVGSPFFGLKKRLLPLLTQAQMLPESLEWRPSDSISRTHSRPAWIHDLRTGKIEGTKDTLAPSSVNSRILQSLLSDLYRPRHLLEFHSEVYPREQFSPTSTPLKIHQALFRFRRWYEERGLAVSAHVENGLVALQVPKGAAFRIPVEAPWLDPKQGTIGALAVAAAPTQLGLDLMSLGRRTGDQPFTAAEVAAHFGVSQRTANRFLKDLVENGYLLRESAGRATIYAWSKSGLNLLGLSDEAA